MSQKITFRNVLFETIEVSILILIFFIYLFLVFNTSDDFYYLRDNELPLELLYTKVIIVLIYFLIITYFLWMKKYLSGIIIISLIFIFLHLVSLVTLEDYWSDKNHTNQAIWIYHNFYFWVTLGHIWVLIFCARARYFWEKPILR